MGIRSLAAGMTALLLAACGETAPEGGGWRFPAGDSVLDLLACGEREGFAFISAHRGGPADGLPENAIETFDAMLAAAPVFLEVDVAASKDGVLFLLHDDTLDRTTTGSGDATSKDWAELKSLRLKDNDGRATDYAIPTLDATLEWARGRAVLQLDIKRSARYEDVAMAVARAGMRDHVIYIAYTAGQARKLSRTDPRAALSATVDSLADLEELNDNGVPQDRILAWTGNDRPRPALFEALQDEATPVIFGTLGGGNSIDAEIDRQRDWNRYRDIVDAGVDLLATDAPRRAFRTLSTNETDDQLAACGIVYAAPEQTGIAAE